MTGTRTPLRIATAHLAAEVDLERGAEITALTDLRTGLNVLMTTPWAGDARAHRPIALAADARDSEAEWTASYAGGWQTLFPHAGSPTVVDGQLRHYHGEASGVPWALDDVSPVAVDAHVELSTVPVRMERRIEAALGTVTVVDTIVNHSSREVTYDYQSHPAFGAPFLEDGCTVQLEDGRYTPDPRFDFGELEPGTPVRWPTARGRAGLIDLSSIPAADARTFRFGWLDHLATSRVTVSNARLDLAATLLWSGEVERSVAWLWLDAGAQPAAPWSGRGYAFAVEPSTRTTYGDGQAPRLAPGARTTFTTSLSLHRPHS